MAAGIEVYNNNNILQITDKFRNLQFIEKITLSSFNSLDIQEIPNDLSSFYAFREITGTSSIAIIYVGSSIIRFFAKPATSAVVEVFRFGYSTTVSSGGGFQVFNSNGEIVFDSNNKYMRVIDSRHTNNLGSGIILSHDTSIKTAILAGSVYTYSEMYNTDIMGGSWYTWQASDAQVFNFYEDRIETKVENLSSSLTSGTTNSGYFNERKTSSFLVLDVTNY